MGGRIAIADAIDDTVLGEQAAALGQCPHCGSDYCRQRIIWS
jgi:hypothetical protein